MAINSNLDENKLLFELSQGNEIAFTTLYNRYKNVVYSSALKITKSKTLSEEVVQDVFMKIWLKKEELTDITDFESYLFISGRNQIFNMIKKIAREDTFKNVLKHTDSSFNATDSFLKDEQYNILLSQILLKLPPQQQKIYQMAKVEGLSHQKIAEILDISPLTVKKHMAQALKLIRVQLARHINLIIISFGYFFTQNI
ncbi:RNA polymerase sigma-70 factor (ECF subfamily) [Flavobacterium sp. 90]|uniref:RNA polymerase sigma factor n=1 Tax=unclassified Flavobacterium TaxID=196869 RepID=UPI000EACB483|nr:MULTISPECIES: sigma-70 family RNA polymerase sigma factor [unclassified Flavobacterium]RKR11853.1 RNA polymerase sigma-70 factor (ECF subfamily) [Flavobacterium sp. 81]TCK55627.1 RNA polymerase sigma-70 factor (ECF subfamily) [Flavobacterium sp. 90]